MNKLLERAVIAHGGLERWNAHTSLSARVRGGGALWALKGQDEVLSDVISRVDLHRQHTSTSPFGEPGLRTSFTPDRVAIETEAGEVVEERFRPRESFAGHELNTQWDRLHLAYFNGYAMWTYLTEPFSLTWPGFEAEELGPWEEEGETWQRLKVVFPDDLAYHSKENVYYIDDHGLIRRHDYVAHVVGEGAAQAAHYSSGHREFDGITLPTRRRVYATDQDGYPVKEPLMVSIDLDEFKFE